MFVSLLYPCNISMNNILVPEKKKKRKLHEHTKIWDNSIRFQLHLFSQKEASIGSQRPLARIVRRSHVGEIMVSLDATHLHDL